ncbi:TPA: type IV pilin protein [Pseudomonas aeruginosa]|nr:type IV pilin protein [Pseudomonas aeruginosa]HEJ4205642.1 type IV pilin protein [Pseudomonas aeruginosa]HEJ4210346.1 type IV pilin protein [Pseudomonas aeruginosa]HEJ4256186.1 type IV pilin protein [Pseudomonas aeruginosa]HEJ9618108.1 type IV pilin protein [Pseudomonas aeruginosa]
MRTRQKGFTLLEMVVVVAVIGILLGIAIPSYQNYVIRSNRTEGQALLSDAAARQERYYSQTRDKTCGKLTLNQLGERGAAGKTGNNSTVNDCWR